MEAINNERFQELVEYDLIGKERRVLFAGEKPFTEDQKGVARVAMLGDEDTQGLSEGLRSDSDVDVLIPTEELDSEECYRVSMVFFLGARPVVLMKADRPLPRTVCLFAADGARQALEGIDLGDGSYHEVAFVARNLGRWMLEARTRTIEQSVRDALDDEVMSGADYEALRRYPERLARVESLAQRIRSNKPQWRSHEPPSRFPSLDKIQPDMFIKHLSDAEADARGAVSRLSGLISSQQIVLTQRQGEQTERFERLVTIVGAAVLVPGLVAGIFGANVGLPGRETSAGFWAMLALMSAGGIGSFALIRWLESERWRQLLLRHGLKRVREISPEAQLKLLAGLALVLAAIGLALMVTAGDSPG